ncbi:MAG: reverse transcriptase domain-containing protein [Pseudonocardiaceae bacterium]
MPYEILGYVSSFDWFNALDFKQALANLHYEFPGDWHRDPWGWPELEFLLAGGGDALRDFCNADSASEPALLDVPKENWGTRPAIVLNPVDRLTYQALVDRLSVEIAGNLTPNAFGWRLPAISPRRGNYSHNSRQWELYRNHLSLLAGIYPVALKTDIVSCFASMPLETIQDEVDGRTPSNHVSRRLLTLLAGFNATPHRSGLPQRSTASAVIANMILIALDDVLEHHARPLPDMLKRGVQYHSFARWMDDMWLFGDDPGQARRTQVELQRAAQTVGLNLNAAKTEVLENGMVRPLQK